MKERYDIKFATWRKKVDRSLFDYKGLVIPGWAQRMWNLKKLFGGVVSRKDPRAATKIAFKNHGYSASVTATKPRSRANAVFRLWYEDELCHDLKHAFPMSYMRSLEERLDPSQDIEKQIPFWEFLDVEFDGNSRVFRFSAHYTVRSTFPNLFRLLVGSPAVRRVEDDIAAKPDQRIYKQGWKPRSLLKKPVHRPICLACRAPRLILWVIRAYPEPRSAALARRFGALQRFYAHCSRSLGMRIRL